jgi:hypothetical protein
VEEGYRRGAVFLYGVRDCREDCQIARWVSIFLRSTFS